ncbi:MAG: UvrD-helicase domain-containing protein [Actinobacteria bacterium]|nr:UvrD-helicase domain-containing protein [Actinomycetota bacterium]
MCGPDPPVCRFSKPSPYLAGPETGKTRVIVERVARLIESKIAKPQNLLVLTFSRRAAKEMRRLDAGGIVRTSGRWKYPIGSVDVRPPIWSVSVHVG